MSSRLSRNPSLEHLLEEQLARCRELVALGEALRARVPKGDIAVLLERRRALLAEIDRLQVRARLASARDVSPQRTAALISEIRNASRQALALDAECLAHGKRAPSQPPVDRSPSGRYHPVTRIPA